MPGEVITRDAGLLRGHGTYTVDASLVATTAGIVERVGKLVTVRPVKGKYVGEVGDIVVGRVKAVGSKRWLVEIAAMKDGILHLSSVNLPGGEQRKRNYEDALHMRAFFSEGDLISAEVQSTQQDGSCSVHTRSLRYGKLENGLLFVAPSHLVQRLKQHSVSLDCGVDVIIGLNGYIWISRSRPEVLGAEAEAETIIEDRLTHATTMTLPEERLRICRVRNAIAALCSVSAGISPETIMQLYRRSEDMELPPKALLDPGLIQRMLDIPAAEDAHDESEDDTLRACKRTCTGL